MNETRSSAASDFTTYMSVEVKAGGESHITGGTLFGKSRPRLVLADGFNIEVEPVETILAIFNKDVPGVIGEIGRILGENGINIANMYNGRKSIGGEALTVVIVDSKPDDKVVRELTDAVSITAVKVISLD